MSAQHTPGPWLLTVESTNVPGVNVSFRIDAPAKRSMCNGQSQEHLDCESAVMEDECRANARLIAAAPDLLAALQTLMGPIYGLEENLAAYQKARAAIRKATGGA